jgi:YidC/Oxa1 family membrane protein insertase
LPEFHHPVLLPQKPGGNGDLRSLLIFALLLLTLFSVYRYAHRAAPIELVSAVPAQSQRPQPKTFETPRPATGVHSIAPPPDNFGWLAFVAKPLYLALRFLHTHGVGNWGWAIIVLTVIFNLLTAWPRILSTKSSLKMMRIQPKVDAIKKRYAHLSLGDPKRADMNAEVMALYKAEGASTFGGCLPLLLQMPLLFGYMRVLRNAPELHQAHWYWLTDLSSPDPLHILPLVIVSTMIITQCVTPAPGMTASQRWMMAIIMPVAMGFSLWHYASGLSLYWITGNVISMAMQLAINQSRTGKEMQTLIADRSASNFGRSQPDQTSTKTPLRERETGVPKK